MLSSEEDEEEEGNGPYKDEDDDENDATQPEKQGGSETMGAGGSVRSFSAESPDGDQARTDPEPAGTLTPVQATKVLTADATSAVDYKIEALDPLVQNPDTDMPADAESEHGQSVSEASSVG